MASQQELGFDTYFPKEHYRSDLFSIGKVGKTGVLEEMAVAFGHHFTPQLSSEEFRSMIGKVGPAKTLQDNIGQVQEILGTNKDAIAIARDWVGRSGLLHPVDRNFYNRNRPAETPEIALISGGVRNWMARRAKVLESLPDSRLPETVLLVGGRRTMSPSEGEDVTEGMKESDYLREIVLPLFQDKGMDVVSLAVDSEAGDDVMRAAALHANEICDLATAKVAVIANAGNWPQNAGQFIWGAKAAVRGGFNSSGDQVWVISDTIALGTGTEPTLTHQNPFSALGQMARNFYEFSHTVV